MTRTVQKITQHLIDRLPENDQYYRLDELRSWAFPSFIVKRIKIELERNLAESMIPPKTDWANIQSDAVQDAWQQFVDAIRAEARLPASYAKTVIETAVADVLEMLVQPRKNIPEVIFRTDENLSYEQVLDRVETVVVYRHFATLVPRYMQKKELDELSKERCKKVVKKSDEKLTARYSPLNWAQMLEPLFKLVDGDIDTNLLRLFFEDKKMPRIAREFDLMNDSLTRAQFIEVLSSPDLLDFEGYEDDQSSLFEDQPVSSAEEEEDKTRSVEKVQKDTHGDKETKSKSGEEENDEDEDYPDSGQISEMLFPKDDNQSGNEESVFTKNKKSVRDKDSTEADEQDDDLNTGFTDQEEVDADAEEKGSQDEDNSLNALFGEQEDEESEPIEDVDTETEQRSLEERNDQENNESSDEETDEVNGQSTAIDQQDDDKDSGMAEPRQENEEQQKSPFEGNGEETPMWMRYMSEEEIEEYKKQELDEEGAKDLDEEDEDLDEDGFVDDPIIDLTNKDATDKEIDELRQLLEDDRELFVEEIFRGSDRAYDEAIEEIASYNKWRNASKYIEKDIFKRNLVDMYSEEAVDFTDRLQSYFLEKQNQNK